MNILYEEIKDLENYVLNEIIYFTMDKKYEANVEEAKNIFLQISEGESSTLKEQGFLIWLLWDYKLDNSNNFIEEYFKVNKDNLGKEMNLMMKSLLNSSFSVYEISFDSQNLKLKDIFSKDILCVENTMNYNIKDNKSLIIGRIYNYNNENYILEDFISIEKSFKSMIEKNIYEKFQISKNNYGFNGIKSFIDNNSLLVYKLGIIINQLIKEHSEDQDNLRVWQSVYLYNEKSIIESILLDSDNICFDYVENGVKYLKVIDNNEETIQAEILLYNNKMEIECNNEIDFKDTKLMIEDLIGNRIKHLKDEIFTITDII